MQNHKTKAIQRLRTTALDESEAPVERLRAAQRLLIDHGPTDRNVPVINAVVRAFVKDSDYNIAERAAKLKAKLAKARGLKAEISEAELPSDEPTARRPNVPIPETVSTQSLSSPTLSLTWHNLYDIFSETVGNYGWRLFNEEKADLTSDQRYAILEKALCDLPISVQNVKTLISELHKPNDLGWSLATSYGALVRIARDWLDQNGVSVEPPELSDETQSILDRLNRRAEVTQ
jgi:hypothetical protein